MTNEVKFVDGGEIRDFTVPIPTLYVAVFRYENNNTAFGSCLNDKQQLMNQLMGLNGLDKKFPVRIYTIII